MDDKKIILKKLEYIFQVIFDDEQIKLSLETTSSDIEEWDSLANVRIFLEIEKNYNIKLRPEDLEDFETIESFYNFLSKQFISY